MSKILMGGVVSIDSLDIGRITSTERLEILVGYLKTCSLHSKNYQPDLSIMSNTLNFKKT
jgi:hypothetical protein